MAASDRKSARCREYEGAIDRKVAHGGSASLMVRSRVSTPKETFYANQRIKADDYRGKRVRLSGFAKTDGNVSGLRFWLEVWGDGRDLLVSDKCVIVRSQGRRRGRAMRSCSTFRRRR